jgi:succinate dehydrogenase/fumarate reductase flavoprotein subunit
MSGVTGSDVNGVSAGPAVSRDVLSLEADVLVIGGGPAGTWAAWTAASRGAKVVLADKGYCGTSGATAPSGVGVWYVPPDPDAREDARSSREAMGGHLADRAWMDRVLDQTYENVGRLADWGLVATARWMYTTARHREESRGMHKHQDFPQLDPTQQRRLVTSGLDTIQVRPEQVAL